MTTSVSVASATRADARLDLVRDVRDHLHGRAEVLALALLAQHAIPDRACGVVRGAREVLVDEALVVADVEVGLGAVLGDEDLAVLERAHRARVDVQVRVELLHLHLQAARLEQPAERCRRDALAERRDDAAGDEDVLRSLQVPSGLPVNNSRNSTLAATTFPFTHLSDPTGRRGRCCGSERWQRSERGRRAGRPTCGKAWIGAGAVENRDRGLVRSGARSRRSTSTDWSRFSRRRPARRRTSSMTSVRRARSPRSRASPGRRAGRTADAREPERAEPGGGETATCQRAPGAKPRRSGSTPNARPPVGEVVGLGEEAPGIGPRGRSSRVAPLIRGGSARTRRRRASARARLDARRP